MKYLLLVIALVLVATVSAAPLSDEQYSFLFTKFVDQYKKNYEVNDYLNRFAIFKANLDYVVQHNAQKSTWTAGLNEFSDLSQAEFSQMMGLQQVPEAVAPQKQQQQQPCPFASQGKAGYVSWLKHFGPIKNQGSCGSCWAFGANGAVEAALSIQQGVQLNLSEQELVDCDKLDSGCNGGLPEKALTYLSSGVCSTAEYPYTAKGGLCQSSKCTKVAKVTGYKAIPTSTDGAAHLEALQTGPINIGINGSAQAFQLYKSGVVTLDKCTSTTQNHAVIMVAYEHDDASGLDYLLVRNSWGTTWGEEGYIKIEAVPKACGMMVGIHDRGYITAEKM